MPTEPFLFEADQTEFLERMRRSRRLIDQLTSKSGVNVEAWSAEMKAVLKEVEPLPLVVGVRYRIRLFGGDPTFRHFHGTDTETGETLGFDLPTMEGSGMVEVEGIYRGRPYTGPWKNLIHLDLAGKDSYVADSDVLRCEEIR